LAGVATCRQDSGTLAQQPCQPNGRVLPGIAAHDLHEEAFPSYTRDDSRQTPPSVLAGIHP
jgi:hypothetical protein